MVLTSVPDVVISFTQSHASQNSELDVRLNFSMMPLYICIHKVHNIKVNKLCFYDSTSYGVPIFLELGL